MTDRQFSRPHAGLRRSCSMKDPNVVNIDVFCDYSTCFSFEMTAPAAREFAKKIIACCDRVDELEEERLIQWECTFGKKKVEE